MSRARQPLDGWPRTLFRPEKRRAFLVGMMLVDAMEDDPECRKAVLEQLDFFLTQPRDRRLFDLPPLPSVCPTADQPVGLRAVMHVRGPSFLDLLPPVSDADPGLWLSSVNIDAPGPSRDELVAIMDATVAAAPDLKRLAGGSGLGESGKPGLHYALYWGERDAPRTRQQAENAARASLRALGLQEHQALLLGHGDAAHPHVHVLVNRVHPATGRTADNRGYWVVLRDWAKSYGRQPDIRPTSAILTGSVPPDAA